MIFFSYENISRKMNKNIYDLLLRIDKNKSTKREREKTK